MVKNKNPSYRLIEIILEEREKNEYLRTINRNVILQQDMKLLQTALEKQESGRTPRIIIFRSRVSPKGPGQIIRPNIDPDRKALFQQLQAE